VASRYKKCRDGPILERESTEVYLLDRYFEEVQVFDSVGELTGNRVDRASIRGRAAVCRSITELASKFRRMGDGYYYVAATAWPADTKAVNLVKAWEPLG
jgi:hypothetical protein